MSFRHMYQDVQSERLLLVCFDDSQRGSGDYRHIRATVVRRAVPHKMKDYSDSAVETWNDDYPAKCRGYRVASYVLTKTSGTFVDDMQLRGQIDLNSTPTRNGRPYGNEIKFKPYDVDHNTARAIADFYTKYEKYCDKANVSIRNDNFTEGLNVLSKFLKIDNFLFFKTGINSSSLESVENFEECDILGANGRIDKMLAPYLQEPSAS